MDAPPLATHRASSPPPSAPGRPRRGRAPVPGGPSRRAAAAPAPIDPRAAGRRPRRAPRPSAPGARPGRCAPVARRSRCAPSRASVLPWPASPPGSSRGPWRRTARRARTLHLYGAATPAPGPPARARAQWRCPGRFARRASARRRSPPVAPTRSPRRTGGCRRAAAAWPHPAAPTAPRSPPRAALSRPSPHTKHAFSMGQPIYRLFPSNFVVFTVARSRSSRHRTLMAAMAVPSGFVPRAKEPTPQVLQKLWWMLWVLNW